jgi:hypothetical protein
VGRLDGIEGDRADDEELGFDAVRHGRTSLRLKSKGTGATKNDYRHRGVRVNGEGELADALAKAPG